MVKKVLHGGMVGEFIPSGYLSIGEALDRLGRRLFPSEWTGDEHKARRGLISADKWLRVKDMPPPRGSDAGSGAPRRTNVPPEKPQPHYTGDPSDPSYQEEYRARDRYDGALHRLRQLLEAGELEARILDPFSGALHRAPSSLWRQHGADRIIEKGQALVPGSPNTGSLLVKRFAEAKPEQRPIPQAKLQDAIEVLKEKLAVESLTRALQKDFLRKTFPNHAFTERQFNQIFRAVRVPTGRPRKSDK